MKCDELEKWEASLFSPSAMVYGTFEVDEAIAELKAQNKSLKAKLAENDEEIESLRASQRAKRTPSYRYGKCNRCGRNGKGFSRVLDGMFLCVGCLCKDEVERKFKEAK